MEFLIFKEKAGSSDGPVDGLNRSQWQLWQSLPLIVHPSECEVMPIDFLKQGWKTPHLTWVPLKQQTTICKGHTCMKNDFMDVHSFLFHLFLLSLGD